MKKCRYWLAIALVALPNYLAASTTLRLAYSDIGSYPFQIGNGNKVASPPGLALDVINQVAHELDINVEYVRRPGKRVLHEIEKNKVDGGFIFSHNAERARYASYPLKDGKPDPSKRVGRIGYYFYKLKSQPLERDGIGIRSKTQLVGAHLGFSIIGELKRLEINIHEVKTTKQLFAMLRAKRVAAIAIQDTIAQEYLKDKDWPDIEQLQPAIATKDYYLVFSHQFVRAHPELANRIWTSIGANRDEVISQFQHLY